MFAGEILILGLLAAPQAEAQSAQPGQAAIEEGFDWSGALAQSGFFFGIQHGSRFAQKKMRRELGGPFFADYLESVSHIRTWSDQDGILTNYVGHPMMGAIAGYIQIHNDPKGRRLEFANTPDYWKSRLKALAWSAAYSTQFEIGPIVSEAAIGNVGLHPPTMAWVDLIMTPFGGFGLMVLEDYVDRRWIAHLERSGGFKARFYRVALNPSRAVANLLRLKRPSYRDDRPLP